MVCSDDDDVIEITPLKRVNKRKKQLELIKVKDNIKERKKRVIKLNTEEPANIVAPKFKTVSPVRNFSSSNNKETSPFLLASQPPALKKKYGTCPVCVIDMNNLHGTTPQAHINQCLDIQPSFEKGNCHGDAECLFSNESHFREYKHRENNESADKSNDSIELIANSANPKEEQVFNAKEVEEIFINDDDEDEIINNDNNIPSITDSEIKKSPTKMTQARISSFFKSSSPSGISKKPKNVNEKPKNNTFNQLMESNIEEKPKMNACNQLIKSNTEEKPKPIACNQLMALNPEEKPKANAFNQLMEASIKKTNAKRQKQSDDKKVVKEDKPKFQSNRKQCPFYKKIPGTGITVDAFRYGEIPGCLCYFLSHYHADHYGGLNRRFNGKLYCSKITGNLVKSELKVDDSCVVTIPMEETVQIENFKVTLFDANHCPGAVMFLFELSNNQRILHVGDFRADVSMTTYPLLTSTPLSTIYLDTTYCNPKYSFPPQRDTIKTVAKISKKFISEKPKTLIVVGTYTIGKERVFRTISENLGLNKIAVSKNKMKVLNCLEDKWLNSRLTLDYNLAQLHVLPMAHLTFEKLNQHLSQHNINGKYTNILAFKPTGWTFSNKLTSLDDIKPTVKGPVTFYGIPYSEHSSFEELKWFISTLKPNKIIPTVNIGSKPSRDKMEKHFKEWLS